MGTLRQVIEFGAIQHILNRRNFTTMNALCMEISMYEVINFKIVVVNTDNEFECMRE